MRLEIGTEIQHLEPALRGLDNLSRITQHRYAKRGLRRAGQHLRASGRRRLRATLKGQATSGNLYRSMSVKLKSRTSRTAGALAGFRRGWGGGAHAHLVDLGTAPRYTRSGKHRGRVKGSRFWSDTKRLEAGRASALVIEGLEAAVNALR